MPAPKYCGGDRVVPDLDVFDGDIVRAEDGSLWMARVKRGRSMPALPFVAGRPRVSCEDVRRFQLDDEVLVHTGCNYYGHGGQPLPQGL